jgi:hypothetical protein
MLLTKAKLALVFARIINANRLNVQATVITIINYNCNMFIVQASGLPARSKTMFIVQGTGMYQNAPLHDFPKGYGS